MTYDHFDSWLKADGPVALVLREELEPALGTDSALFPPTFAPGEGSKDAPSYVIDDTADGRVALVDTVGSQANRLEPLFKEPPYSELVPAAAIHVGDRQISLLDAGHRAADAVVRFSSKAGELRDAFLSIRERKDAVPLAKLAPTSLVFGVWDSRDTQVKLPRIIGSTIRAYKVEKLTRAAQFFAVLDKDEIQDLGTQDFLSKVGLDDAPAGRTEGGVVARGGIRREAQLNLIALRALTGRDNEASLKLQRYILGLALVAFLAKPQRFLREGCLLVSKADAPADVKVVARTGDRSALDVDEAAALAFARAAARDFGTGPDWQAQFDRGRVGQALADKDSAKKGSGKTKAKK
jgi:CRISPR-associated protein Csb1